MDEPTIQVARINTTVDGVTRRVELTIGTWHGETQARFGDLPRDIQEALLDWVHAEKENDGSTRLPCYGYAPFEPPPATAPKPGC